MGLFGTNTQTVAITQTANGGQSTADVSVNIPLWEVIFVCCVVFIMMNLLQIVLKNCLDKYVQRRIVTARTLEDLNREV